MKIENSGIFLLDSYSEVFCKTLVDNPTEGSGVVRKI